MSPLGCTGPGNTSGKRTTTLSNELQNWIEFIKIKIYMRLKGRHS
jgi:hypothetical protein